MSSKCDAIKRLFRDNDPDTVGKVKEQLILQGESALGDLRSLVNADSAIVAAHAQEVLHAIAGKKAAASFEEFLRGSGEIHLEEASWLVAGALMPWLDLDESRMTLDILGAGLGDRINGADPVPVLTGYLHGELGFTGNSDDYYKHENSLLPCVLETKKGLPLTLTLIYMFVGARAGVTVYGVNLPGHFIARCGETYFDPFHEGRILSRADCVDLLSLQKIEFRDEHLANPGPREVMARMLANLRHAFEVEEANWQRQMVDRWIGILTGAES